MSTVRQEQRYSDVGSHQLVFRRPCTGRHDFASDVYWKTMFLCSGVAHFHREQFLISLTPEKQASICKVSTNAVFPFLHCISANQMSWKFLATRRISLGQKSRNEMLKMIRTIKSNRSFERCLMLLF